MNIQNLSKEKQQELIDKCRELGFSFIERIELDTQKSLRVAITSTVEFKHFRDILKEFLEDSNRRIHILVEVGKATVEDKGEINYDEVE